MRDTPAQRHRRKLLCAQFTAEQLAPMDEQIRDIVGYHVESLNPRAPLADQLQALARDCYLQGLMDGQQVRVPGVGNV